MVDWQSQEEIIKDGNVFSKLMHCLLGIYLWEFFISLPFDFDFFLGRKAFKWPLIFYFAGRYSLLFALIGIAIALNVTQPIDCQSLYIFNQVFGNAAIGFASINLSLRTIAVWSQALYIVVPLVLIILGHWSLLLHGLLISAAWVPPAGCTITKTDNTILAATFIYSMCFDFLVLCLTAYKLLFPNSGRSRLVKLIFNDGLIFFIVAFLANLLATVFMLLNLNAVMSIIFNVPAAIASTIVASRAVRRLTKFTSKGPEVFTSRVGQASSTLAFRGTGPYRSGTMSKKGDGVHIQMDTITALADAELGDRSFLEYDASGKVIGENYTLDPTNQEISDEFKRPPY
ncbi:uncharacterized protein FOMMEDRAFT_23201 [Fomitiporia mediterranea MF3/22]|uniref:uncharacterized protein n=1 Tax=Fomitiporia mediterranea (strain MF3/22) TaxID=694068 RepID=UPI000440879D|nr:uncharacterized protein FOMMEDRAFT_23201 [Fomitiporia mediterranea MF3/22]EJC99330.1 hypothetical protein FOMMEDRAFT_23201 [Fomitiporia mediterranea MF3/22]